MMDTHHRWNVSFKPLLIGLVASIILTIGAYRLAQGDVLSRPALLWVIAILGAMQAVVQLIFFLHVTIENKPRWNLFIFLFMVLLIIILIGGSLWIMYNLNYHMMPMTSHETMGKMSP